MSILDQAVPASSYVESINMFLYGDPGAGKTTFAGSGRESGKNDLIIAVEHGTISAARSGSKANVIEVKDYNTLIQVVDAICEEPDRFEWVTLDSLTKTQDIIWEHILDQAVQKAPGRSRFKKELQEYGEAQEMLKDIVRRLNGSDANIIYTAFADLDDDEEGNAYRRPDIHGQEGKLAHWICGEVDLLCYLTVGRKEGKLVRAFQFNKSDKVLAKDRFGLFKRVEVDLTLEKLTNTILDESEKNIESEEN